MLKVILCNKGNDTRAEFRELPRCLSKLQSRRRRGRMTGGRKGRTFYNVCSCRRARQRRRRRQQHETMSPPLETPSYAARAFLPSSTFRVADLACPLRVRMHWSGSGGKTKLPMGRFFLALPPLSFSTFLPPSFLLFLLSGSLSRWMGLRLRRTGWKGSPLIPTLLSRRSGVIAKGEDHVALKGILDVSVFSLFA